MAIVPIHSRVKVHGLVDKISKRFHFAPLEEGPIAGKLIHRNLVLMALSYLLNENHLLIGEPGWGKTTGAKVVASALSGLPYDLYDSVEIRGHPQLYDEKVTGVLDFGRLNREGKMVTLWHGTFGVDVVIVDEVPRLSLDMQDVILQGIDTGRWKYMRSTYFAGKPPAFLTMNEKDGDRENGLLPALRDRIGIVTEEQYFSTMVAFDLHEAKKRVEAELCKADFTQKALEALDRAHDEYKKILAGERPIKGALTKDEKARIQEEIAGLELDNDGMLFLQAFMAEINYSAQYGSKRAADPRSPDTHDLNYAGVNVKHSFSPRSAMTAIAYAKALAWFLQESPTLDHIRFVLPHVFGHKAHFHDDYVNAHAGDPRVDCVMLHLAKSIVTDVHGRYTASIQPAKNLISRIQKGEIAIDDPVLDETKHDHPLMKDLARAYKAGQRHAFYSNGEE